MGNATLLRLWDIYVVFTNALPEEPTYVLFPDNMPDDIILGFEGGDCAILLRNLYSSKTASKQW